MSPPTLTQRKYIWCSLLQTLPLVEGVMGVDGVLMKMDGNGKESISTTDNVEVDADANVATIASKWADALAPRSAGCVASDMVRMCKDALTSALTRVRGLPSKDREREAVKQ